MRTGVKWMGAITLAVAVGAGAYLLRGCDSTSPSSHEASPSDLTGPSGSASPGGDSAEDGLLCKLQGKDFKVECAADQDEYSERITVTFSNGKVPEYVESDGKSDHAVNTVFSREDKVMLEKWIPGEPREQLVVEGEDYLPQGQGSIRTRNIYHIQEDGIREVAHLILSREPGEDSPSETRRLSAEARLEPEGVIVYEASVDGGPARRIELKWDGQRFADPTGEFEKLSQEFNP